MKKRTIGTVALAALLGLSLASCKDKVNYEDYDFTSDASAKAVATSGDYYSYVDSSYSDRTEILGLLEEFAMKNNLTGLVLYDDGGYVKVNDRLEIPTATTGEKNGAGEDFHTYVTGYGFGILEEGKATRALNVADNYKTYYHTYEVTNPETVNYWNSQGETVGDAFAYVSSSYFSQRLDMDTKTTYEWYPSLATEANQITVDGEVQYRPIPVDEDGETVTSFTGQPSSFSTYRIYVRTGEDMKYAINTSSDNGDYNGREVVLDDYLTPFKELWNSSNGLARGTDGLTGSQAIKGAQEYYNATSKGFDQEAWDNVGIKAKSDDKGSYLEFTFVTPCTPFYAMYYLSSGLYEPIPAEFITEIGGFKNFGSSVTDKGWSPVDTTLSTGPFYVEAWNPQEYVMKKNTTVSADVLGGSHRYQWDGVYCLIAPAAGEDQEWGWKEFNADHLDSVGIPSTQLDANIDTVGTQKTKGSSTAKMNLNTCTAEEWEALFGVNGSITQTPASGYWDLKPIMSNEDFLHGLSLSINRENYAEKRGLTPSVNYFSDAYMSNPETGESYNATAAHQNVLKEYYGDTLATYGYNEALAAQYFKKAADALIADGTYKVGDTITLEVCWQAQSQIETGGADLDAYIDPIWTAANTGLNLELNHTYVVNYEDIYYNKMMVGQFDIALGGISGNTLNPLNFMEVLKSDNSSGFTLNWGPSTNDPDYATIEWDGHEFTYDALWKAADTGAIVSSDGSLATTYSAVMTKNVHNPDDNNSRTIEIKLNMSNFAKCKVELADVVLCCYEYPNEDGYSEVSVMDKAKYENGVLTINIPFELADEYAGSMSIDLYLSQTLVDHNNKEHVSTQLVSLSGVFPPRAE